jgi:hypothetical protein
MSSIGSDARQKQRGTDGGTEHAYHHRGGVGIDVATPLGSSSATPLISPDLSRDRGCSFSGPKRTGIAFMRRDGKCSMAIRRHSPLDLSGITAGASQPLAESQKDSESFILKTHVSRGYW